jgi:vacuolar-type H+-ATPase subunit E/Vma4
VKHILPLISARLEKQDKNLERVIEAHEKNLKAILKEHREDREVFQEAIKDLTSRMDRVDVRLTSVERVLTDKGED